MSTFVECFSQEKQCNIIVNIDMVTEVAPVQAGGCHLFLQDGRILKVRDDFGVFRQFSMQVVTPDMMATRISKISGKKATVSNEVVTNAS